MARRKKKGSDFDSLPETAKFLIGALSVIVSITISASTVYFTLEKRIAFTEQRIQVLENTSPANVNRLDSRIDNLNSQQTQRIEKLDAKIDTKFDELNKKLEELKETVIRNTAR